MIACNSPPHAPATLDIESVLGVPNLLGMALNTALSNVNVPTLIILNRINLVGVLIKVRVQSAQLNARNDKGHHSR